jgi:excisionase family DNA binding protein
MSSSKTVPAPDITPQTPYEDLKQWLTVAEVATYLDLAEWTIRKNIDRGAIPHRRIGPKIIQIPKTYVHPSNAQVAKDVELVSYEGTR